MKGKADVKFE